MADSKEIEEKDEDPSDRRDSILFWQRWLKGAKKASKRHWDDAAQAWKEYENQGENLEAQNTSTDNTARIRMYPIYWSSCKTLEPAYYSRTPKVRGKRVFDIDDELALDGAWAIQRLAHYLMHCSDFDSAVHSAVGDFIHADKACLQVVYNMTPRTEKKRRALKKEGDVYYENDPSEPHEDEVLQDEEGYFFHGEEIIPENQEIKVIPVCYDEILHSPEAKTEDEIFEKAFYFQLSEEEVEAKGWDKDEEGNERALPWKLSKTYDREDKDKDRRDLPGKYLDGWEIWDKRTKQLRIVNENFDDFLDVQPDPMGLPNFFPSTKFIIGSKPRKSLYPTPVYIHLQQTIVKLHGMYKKVFELIEATRRRAIVDADEDIVNALNSEDLEYVAVQNLAKILEKGGLQNIIHYIPVQELVQAITEIMALEEQFKTNFNEWFGTPDILKGITDPIESLGAQEIKTGAAHDRFKYQKKQVGAMVREAAELMVETALNVFSYERVISAIGLEFEPPERQKRFSLVYQMLRDPTKRMVRIEIDIDSMSFIDDNQKIARQQAISETLLNGLKILGSMQTPEFTDIMARSLLESLMGLGASEEYEEAIRRSIKEMMQRQAQPQQEAPDPKLLEIQLKQQVHADEVQLKIREADRKDKEFALEAEKLVSQEQIDQINVMLKEKDQELKQAKQTLDEVKFKFDAAIQQILASNELQKTTISEFVAKLSALEQAQQELRLEKEQQIEEERMAHREALLQIKDEMITRMQPPEPKIVQPPSPPIHIKMELPKSEPKTIQVEHDAEGKPIKYTQT